MVSVVLNTQPQTGTQHTQQGAQRFPTFKNREIPSGKEDSDEEDRFEKHVEPTARGELVGRKVLVDKAAEVCVNLRVEIESVDFRGGRDERIIKNRQLGKNFFSESGVPVIRVEHSFGKRKKKKIRIFFFNPTLAPS